MTSFIILAILVALLIWVLMQLSRKKDQPEPLAGSLPKPDLANLKVTDARAGDMISVSGAGDDFSDLDFKADHYTRFDAGAHPWVELSGPYRERTVSLRIAEREGIESDEIDVAVRKDPRKLTLEDLGLAEEDLAQMDERQNTSDSFEFDGKVWYYRRSREVRAWRDGQTSRPTAFYYWEFREQDGKRLLTVRKLEGEPFAVGLYTEIPAGDVTVYRGR
ncbi:MAG TPA: hypothetical protein VKV17_03080 [Bryobacteraceae bacterium]|nr:hypothetical protein [Bryobacteraceae bacterium]